MKEQRNILRTTIIAGILSLIFAILVEWRIDRLFYKGFWGVLAGHREFAVNMGLGIFAGASLAAGISYISYKYQENKYIDECCEYLNSFIQKLSKLKYLYFLIDVNLLCRLDNAQNNKLNVNSVDDINEEIINWYKTNYPSDSPEILKNQDFGREKDLPEVIASYNEILQFDILKADTFLEQRDTSFKKTAENAELENALNHIKKLYGTIKEHIDYIKEFGSKANQLKTLYKLQNYIFDDVEYAGSIAFLPPRNREIHNIYCMINRIKMGGNRKENKPDGSDSKNV